MRPAAAPAGSRPGMLASIRDGLEYVRNDQALSTLLLMIGVLNFCTTGPFAAGLASLAKARFGSAAAYGTLLSCYGGGALAGMAMAGAARRLHHRGMVMLVIAFALAAGFPVIGLVPRFAVVAVVMAAFGMIGGFANVVMTAWMQQRVEAQFIGRVMSLLMFSAVGLMPVSLVIAGAVAQAHIAALFVGAGVLVFAVGIIGSVSKATRAID